MQSEIDWKIVVLIVATAALNTAVFCWYAVEKSKYENPWIKAQYEITGIRH